MMSVLRLYHRTTKESAEAILCEGFVDSRQGNWPYRGVFLSDIAADCQDGAKEGALIEVVFDLPEHEILKFLIEDTFQQVFFEFLVPSEIIKRHAKLRQLSDDEVSVIETWTSEVRLKRSGIELHD